MAHSLSSDSGVGSEQLPVLLSAGWRVLRLDMRGHGGRDPAPGDYTMSELAGDVILTLDFLQLDRVHFAGVSIGGMIVNTTPDGYRGGAAAIINFDIRAKLPSIKAPTLVICGDEDTGTPPEGNRLIASRIPRRPL